MEVRTAIQHAVRQNWRRRGAGAHLDFPCLCAGINIHCIEVTVKARKICRTVVNDRGRIDDVSRLKLPFLAPQTFDGIHIVEYTAPVNVGPEIYGFRFLRRATRDEEHPKYQHNARYSSPY